MLFHAFLAPQPSIDATYSERAQEHYICQESEPGIFFSQDRRPCPTGALPWPGLRSLLEVLWMLLVKLPVALEIFALLQVAAWPICLMPQAAAACAGLQVDAGHQRKPSEPLAAC